MTLPFGWLFAFQFQLSAGSENQNTVPLSGGVSAPYIWMKCPGNLSSWEFFDKLLDTVQVVGTPGEGFGKNGQGFFRLTSFGSREDTLEAVRRLETVL